MSKANKTVKVSLPQFLVNFSDKKSQFSQSYRVDSQDEPTAWQWVEKQRDLWIASFKTGETELTDPKSWKVIVSAAA